MSQTNYKDNDWAKTVKQEHIHIDEAESGKKGYYCLGCGKEMVAVQKTNPKHRSFFRHWAKDVDRDIVKCVVASKVYRERLAEQILHRLKIIPVPVVLKFPPKGVGGLPMLLREKENIVAHKVRSQISFYEDDLGEIHSGKNPGIEERHLLIRPDVTFFDEEDKAILFIEFVINHKPSDEKKLKLQRLGIDTIQIIIPKKPEPEIEKTLKSIRSTKWVYNGKEANTEYVSPSGEIREGVLDLDEIQRKLFEESYNCRSAQITWLIRAVKRNLESESYRRAEQLFEQEISRITAATDAATEELEGLERGIEEEIRGELQKKFAKEEGEVDRRRKKCEVYGKRLEDRYHELEEEFIRDEEMLDSEFARVKTEIEREEEEYRKEERAIDEFIRRATKSGGTEEDIRAGYKAEEENLKKQIQIIEGRTANIREQAGTAQRQAENSERKAEDLESKIENFGAYALQEEGRIEPEFEAIQIKTTERISKRNAEGDTELSDGIAKVLRTRGLSRSFDENRSSIQKLGEALKFINGGSWRK